jgi:hypothetical protein
MSSIFSPKKENSIMYRSTRIVAALLMLGVLCMFAVPAVAGVRYSRWTEEHTAYGVSQFLNARATGYGSYVKLVNPTPVTMIVAIIVYDASTGGGGVGARTYADYRVLRLEPHEAASYDGEGSSLGGMYVEIIAVPETKVRVGVRRYIADGLGIVGTFGFYGGGKLRLAHPRLFNLPVDGISPGQRQQCIDDINAGLQAIGAPRDSFKDFGINAGWTDIPWWR